MSQDSRELPITFGAFLVSLASSAMVHLGEAPDPVTNTTSTDLALARQTIQLIEILEAKTKGNLDDDETRLMASMLYELRLRYVERSRTA